MSAPWLMRRTSWEGRTRPPHLQSHRQNCAHQPLSHHAFTQSLFMHRHSTVQSPGTTPNQKYRHIPKPKVQAHPQTKSTGIKTNGIGNKTNSTRNSSDHRQQQPLPVQRLDCTVSHQRLLLLIRQSLDRSLCLSSSNSCTLGFTQEIPLTIRRL